MNEPYHQPNEPSHLDDLQDKVTNLCVRTALLLLQYGAESALVVQLASRLGKALGMHSVECVLSPNGITITTIFDDRSLTNARQNHDRGINMQVVSDIHHIVIDAEHHQCGYEQIKHKLDTLNLTPYNPYLVVVMIGLSCACFAHLAGGDSIACLITFIASALGMYVRQTLSRHHFNPFIVYNITAFAITLISGMAAKYQLGNDPHIAIASSVLLLVPGFPLTNAFADVLEGYILIGTTRWITATVLTLGTCIGIVFALSLLRINFIGV